jgi:hypothetical protein
MWLPVRELARKLRKKVRAAADKRALNEVSPSRHSVRKYTYPRWETSQRGTHHTARTQQAHRTGATSSCKISAHNVYKLKVHSLSVEQPTCQSRECNDLIARNHLVILHSSLLAAFSINPMLCAMRMKFSLLRGSKIRIEEPKTVRWAHVVLPHQNRPNPHASCLCNRRFAVLPHRRLCSVAVQSSKRSTAQSTRSTERRTVPIVRG